jgi:hypothetical protein
MTGQSSASVLCMLLCCPPVTCALLSLFFSSSFWVGFWFEAGAEERGSRRCYFLVSSAFWIFLGWVPLAQSPSCVCLSLSPVLEMAKTMVTLSSGFSPVFPPRLRLRLPVLGAPPLFFVLSLAFIKARECHAVASKY